MSCSDQKIEVGMIIENSSHLQYKITRIAPRDNKTLAYASFIQKDGTLREEEAFGYLTDMGRPMSWGTGWTIISLPKTHSSATQAGDAENYSNKVFNFFRTSSHPENCGKCGAPKPCSYHP